MSAAEVAEGMPSFGVGAGGSSCSGVIPFWSLELLDTSLRTVPDSGRLEMLCGQAAVLSGSVEATRRKRREVPYRTARTPWRIICLMVIASDVKDDLLAKSEVLYAIDIVSRS
jgi:hypothetical protein